MNDQKELLEAIRETNRLRGVNVKLQARVEELELQAEHRGPGEPGGQSTYDAEFLKSCNIRPWDPGEGK